MKRIKRKKKTEICQVTSASASFHLLPARRLLSENSLAVCVYMCVCVYKDCKKERPPGTFCSPDDDFEDPNLRVAKVLSQRYFHQVDKDCAGDGVEWGTFLARLRLNFLSFMVMGLLKSYREAENLFLA